jgi:hypothetical protein
LSPLLVWRKVRRMSRDAKEEGKYIGACTRAELIFSLGHA